VTVRWTGTPNGRAAGTWSSGAIGGGDAEYDDDRPRDGGPRGCGTGDDSHLGTTNQRLHQAVITVTDLDNGVDTLAAGDYVVLYLYRDASNTGVDTMTGDASVVM